MKILEQIKLKASLEKQNDARLCKKCNAETAYKKLLKNSMICPACGEYNRMNARERINLIADKGSFVELDNELESKNVISFPGYSDKLAKAMETSGENEAVVCGVCKIDGNDCAVFVMNSAFMMGSMGIVVGEKITRLFEHATGQGLPVVGFTASGGARMQEGVFSLMQMAKVSGSVKRHSEAGSLYVTVLTDPTTGGVTASFAMQGDIIIAEPKALVGFAGARVIEQTTGQMLPENFQRAEFLLAHGFIDMISERKLLKENLSKILKFHRSTI